MASKTDPPLDQIIQNCKKCPSYVSKQDNIGHQTCPNHRLCKGKNEWEPENCSDCLQFREKLCTLSPEMHKKSMHILKKVLKKMKKTAKPDSWHFKQKISEFLANTAVGASSTSTRSESISVRSEIDQDNIECSTTSSMASGSMSIRSDINQDNTIHEDNFIHNEEDNVQSTLTEPSFGISQIVQAFTPMFQQLAAQLGQVIGARSNSATSQRSFSPDPDRDSMEAPSQPMETQNLPINSGSERPPFFTEFGFFWFYLTHQHRIEGHKVWLNNELKEFIRHPSKFDAIRTIEDTAQDTPYMTSYQAHETLISLFGADKVTSDKLGPHNRSFRLPLEEESGLAHALRIIHTCTPSALYSIHIGDRNSIASTFTPTAFEAASVINFTSGWNLTSNSDYLKWAKNEVINLKQASEALLLKWMIFVPPKQLQAEKLARKMLVEHISGLGMLNRNIKETKDPRQASGLQATAKQFLAILKDLTLKWVETKYAIRRTALQHSTCALADRLLLSDIWGSTLFAQTEIEALKATDYQHQGFMGMLNLSKVKNDKLKQNPNYRDTKQPKRDRSRSPLQPFRSNSGSNSGKNSSQCHQPTPVKVQYKNSNNKFQRQNNAKKSFTPKANTEKANPSGGSRGAQQQRP